MGEEVDLRETEMKTLILYYSQARGNTRRIAEMIQKTVGAEIAEIETVTPYTGSYEDIVNQGQEEVTAGFMPEIKPLSVNLGDYDTVFLGTPTWWYTMAPAVKTFLNGVDLSGKTVILFQTHGGWPGHVFADMKSMIKGTVISEFAVQFDSTGGDELITPVSEIEKWIGSVKHD